MSDALDGLIARLHQTNDYIKYVPIVVENLWYTIGVVMDHDPNDSSQKLRPLNNISSKMNKNRARP
jgi:hypothetical protein